MDSVVAIQREWLRKLQHLNNKPILIQRHKNNKWHDWQDDIPSLPYHTRSLLPCEICFDPDVRDWQIMKAEMDKLKNFLDRETIPYIIAYTGGKAVHLHVFFRTNLPLPESLIQRIKNCHNGIDVGKEVRLFLANWLLESANVDARVIVLDYGKIGWNSTSKGSMIRIIGSQRENGDYKTVVDSIPEGKPYRMPLRFPETLELWDLATLQDSIADHLERCIMQKKQIENEHLKDALIHFMVRGLPWGGKAKSCMGLQLAIKGGIPESHRDEVATGIAYALRFWKEESRENAIEMISQWCTTCKPPLDFRGRYIDKKIIRIYQKQTMDYTPCTFFMKAGLCSGSQCRIMEAQ